MDTALAQTQATTPMELISQAISSQLDVEKMEKLMAMQERWQKEQNRKAFFSALSQFQMDCPEIRKTKDVAFKETKYSYAPLADIDRQIKPSMRKTGLTKRWEINDDGENMSVTCIVTHEAGHSEITTMKSKADTSGSKNPIQARGSAIEYMKRYTLIGALGITTADTDIDARLPDMDIDKLHHAYMELYNQIIPKDKAFITPGNPDNWQADRTPDLYVKAIAKARERLAQLTILKP